MACHTEAPFSDTQVRWLRDTFMPLSNAHDCCPKCSGLRCLATPRCTDTDCPLRAPVQLDEAA